MKITGIILAGGASRRMGRDKAALAYGSRSLLDHVASVLDTVVDDIVIVGRSLDHKKPYFARTLPDAIPNAGPLGGLVTGLEACTHPGAFVAACDMPWLNPDVVAMLIRRAEQTDRDAVVPWVAGCPQPLHALYRRTALNAIREPLGRQVEARVTRPHTVQSPANSDTSATNWRSECRDESAKPEQPDISLRSMLGRIHVEWISEAELRVVDPGLQSFTNVNTPEEWAAVLIEPLGSPERDDPPP